MKVKVIKNTDHKKDSVFSLPAKPPTHCKALFTKNL
jgi:hypothetical protein